MTIDNEKTAKWKKDVGYADVRCCSSCAHKAWGAVAHCSGCHRVRYEENIFCPKCSHDKVLIVGVFFCKLAPDGVNSVVSLNGGCMKVEANQHDPTPN